MIRKPTTPQQRIRQRKQIARRDRAERQKQRERQRQAPPEKRQRRRKDAVKRVRMAARDMTRRDFLVGAGGAGVLLGLSPLLASCGGDDGAGEVPAGKQRQTLFFNLSHENYASKTYFLTGGGQKYRLTRVADKPAVLAAARKANVFLSQVPDQHITHHLENALFVTDHVTLLYLSAEIDPTVGTWSMSSVYLQIPQQAAAHAYRQARLRTPSGPLPLSPKREMYGVSAAQSEQDLREEQALFDVNAQAATIMGANPDLFSLEPNSAYNIHTNHINNDGTTKTLARALANSQYGPATPELMSGKTNAVGWGTLAPVIDDSTGQPFKNTKGMHAGRIQYQPVFHPDIVEFAGQAVGRLASNVKDDVSLGADVSALKPLATDPPNPALAGVMWARQDGSSFVDQSPAAKQVRDGNAVMTLKEVGPQNGLEVSATLAQASGSPQVTLDMKNWYVRFLGVYLQFLDTSSPPKVLTLANIPEYQNKTIIPGHIYGLGGSDTTTEMFVSVLGPIFTILGIPTWPGFITPSFTVPASTGTVRILASGIGSGSDNYPDTLLAGEVMTGIINYGVTALLCAAGAAAAFSGIMKLVVVPVASAMAQELVALLSSALSGNGPYSAGYWKAQGLALAKFLLTFIAGKVVGKLVGKLVGAIVAASAEGIAEDAIPIAGWIMLGISLAAGAANLIETSAEVALSPWTYINDLVFTHPLSVTVLKDSGSVGPPIDPGDDTFPKEADHYIVTALFDDGTPHVQVLTLQPPVPATLPPVVFKAVPLGGQVNVSVAFYQAATATTQGVLLGKGTTGLIPNNTMTAPTITIQELKFPITTDTFYTHSQKTALDANGKHFWNANAAPPTVNSGNLLCGTAGTLCNFQSISVRQGTATQAGYVGYVWQGENADPSVAPSCKGNSPGQFDQMANLNTGPDAQAGYIASVCGFDNPGVKLAYSLLSHSSANFYLDTSDPNNLYLRQVTLEPPAFTPPGSQPCGAAASNQAWGVLNFMPDALLLHPAGHFVSISTTRHKMETLKIPSASMADCDAQVHLLAQTKSGKGSRPGLMTSPVAAAVAPDGTILVLQFGDPAGFPFPTPAQIQAFDIGGNPKPFFTNQPSPYFLELTQTPNDQGWQYLDIAVEFGGFIYVLSCNKPASSYRMDIYFPTQTGTNPISTTTSFNAAKIAVDFWRNVYALNYEVIPTVSGTPPPRTEPSVSLWVPKNSCTGANCG